MSRAVPGPVEDQPARRRLHAQFSGRVQGVGFRATVQALARRRNLAGWVRNLPDGRVEMAAEGSEAELAGLLEEILGYFEGYVRKTEKRFEPGSGEWADFLIRV